MPQVTPTVVNTTIPTNPNRTIQNVSQVGSQSFEVSVRGLSIGTNLSVYLDFNKLSAAQIHPSGKSAGDPLVTDAFGKATFVIYYTDTAPGLGNRPEAQYINFLDKSSQQLLVVVVDTASINTPALPEDYRTRCRCYATTNIYRSYRLELAAIKDWGSVRQNAGTSVINAG
jgi:hypothetical protein